MNYMTVTISYKDEVLGLKASEEMIERVLPGGTPRDKAEQVANAIRVAWVQRVAATVAQEAINEYLADNVQDID